MPNFLPQWTNQLPWKIVVCSAVAGVLLIVGITYYFTPKYTRVGYEPGQPVPFSHTLHVQQLGMDCRFCHSSVEIAAQSSIPNAQTCMSCHVQITPDSPKLAAVRAAWNDGKGGGPPVNWTRVHQLPDYVYFDHAVHVNRGVSCTSCHGNVDRMDVVSQKQPLSMSWCLDCHRVPEAHLQPLQDVFHSARDPLSPEARLKQGRQLKQEWDVSPPVTCGGCHR